MRILATAALAMGLATAAHGADVSTLEAAKPPKAPTPARCDSLVVESSEAGVPVLRARLNEAARQIGGDSLRLVDKTSGRLSYTVRMESGWVGYSPAHTSADTLSKNALHLDPSGPQAFEQVDFRLVVTLTPIWTNPPSGGRRYVDRVISAPDPSNRTLVTVWAQFVGRPTGADLPSGERVEIASSGLLEHDFIARLRTLIGKS